MTGLKPKHLLRAIIVGVILILALTVGVLFWKYSQLKHTDKPGAQTDSARVLQEVGTIYALPTDEEPTVAQIQDKNKLHDQAFFDKSQNGDYVLVYSKNRLALLFRESEKKLINVGPVNIDNSASNQSQSHVAPATTTTPNTPSQTKR